MERSMTHRLRLRNGKRCISRHDFLERTNQGFIVTLAKDHLQILDHPLSGIRHEHAVFHRATNLRMGCWFDLFRFLKQLFEQFFPWSQPSVDNTDVLVGHHSGQHDHVPSEVRHLDLFSHIKDEHLASLTKYTRLENQLNRFRNCHEKSRDLRMSYGDGTARPNLLGKE